MDPADQIEVEIKFRKTDLPGAATNSKAAEKFEFPPEAEITDETSHQISTVWFNREFSFFNF